MDLIALREAVNAAITRMHEAAEAVSNLAADAAEETVEAAERSLTDSEQAVDTAKRALERAERVERAKNAEPLKIEKVAVEVVSEERTYRRDGEAQHGFFRDLLRAKDGDTEARERLERNVGEFNDAAKRAGLTQTAGAGGELVPPVWYVDQYAAKLRAGRPFLNALGTSPLPAGTNSLNFPKITTGASVAVQADAGAVSNTDLVTTSVTAQVQTEAGRTVASYQTVDLGPITDQVIMDDLMFAYDTQLDSDAINGSVTNAKGVLNVSSPNTVTYTDATPTGPEFYGPVMQAASQISKNAFVGADLILTKPEIWFNILSGLDANSRPLYLAVGPGFNTGGSGDAQTGNGVVGNIAGFPVCISANVPSNLGGGTNEARLVLLNRRGLDFWESTPRFRIADQTNIANLQYQFVVYGYYAVTSRQSKMISIVSGTGLIPVTGF